MELYPWEAKAHVDCIGDHLGHDWTYRPKFPDDRRDIAVVEHEADNGSSNCYTQVYVVAKTADGKLRSREFAHSRDTKDRLEIGKVIVEGETLKFELRNCGMCSGKPWQRTFELPLWEVGL